MPICLHLTYIKLCCVLSTYLNIKPKLIPRIQSNWIELNSRNKITNNLKIEKHIQTKFIKSVILLAVCLFAEFHEEKNSKEKMYNMIVINSFHLLIWLNFYAFVWKKPLKIEYFLLGSRNIVNCTNSCTENTIRYSTNRRIQSRPWTSCNSSRKVSNKIHSWERETWKRRWIIEFGKRSISFSVIFFST